MGKLIDDHSRFNNHIVKNGLRERINVDSVRSYRTLQDLRRRVKKTFTAEGMAEIIAKSASPEFQPDMIGALNPLLQFIDFDNIMDKLDVVKADALHDFALLFDHDPVKACLFIKYPRKFAYLVNELNQQNNEF